MAVVSEETYRAISDLSLYLKNENGEDLRLSDLPTIIPLRWAYFRDNWEFIKQDIVNGIPQYSDPQLLTETIENFSDFIENQRSSTKRINPFEDSDTLFRFYAVFDSILVSNIELTNQEQDIVDAQILRVTNFNRQDFENIRSTFESERDRLSDDIGLTDSTYNDAVNRAEIPSQLDPSITELIRIQKLQQAIRSVEFVLANSFSLTTSFVDPFALARANANNPDIDIASYQSGRLVRLNYGESLQLLARRYLGDSDKWIDIAIANGLKPPYVDEVGEKLSLISNGDGNNINISGTDLEGELNIDKLYINQIILLQSDTQKFPETRRVTNIREIPISGDIVIELDGNPDLDRYRIDESAHIRVYKPNTTNSSFFILIPSEAPLPDDRREETPFFLQGKPEDEKRQKVDLALSDTNDLIFTSNSDLKLSFGIDNAVQAIKLKMQTRLGELRRHPGYGLIDVIGQKNIDKEQVKQSLVESINEQVNRDPRFDRIESISVRYGVPSTQNGASIYAIQMQVRLAGGEQVVPISFTING